MPKGETKDCPECGKTYRVPYLYSHMRDVHNIFGGETGKPKSMPKRKKQPSKALVHVPRKPVYRVVDTMFIVTDDNGGLYIMEKIR
jgi:uncharacterized C2H2 Zn-finger protein